MTGTMFIASNSNVCIRAVKSWPTIAALLLLLSPWAVAQEPASLFRPHPEDMVGMLTCTSVSCHGGAESRQNEISGHAYVLWIGRDATYRDGRRSYDPRAVLERTGGDPHSLAAQRIMEPRFQEVLKRASTRADGTTDPQMYAKCAACHDPQAMHHSLSLASEQHSAEGIGCESCHGGGRRWLTEHYQRGVSRERLKQLGMVDTKDLQLRAKMCAGCHVGSADQDMNHDMIAAGHPPLRFEQASYEALISKHWDDRLERSADSAYEVKLWAAGRLAAADAALSLLEGRAKRSNEGPWPEFAEANCFACHQPLRSDVRRLAWTTKTESGAGVPTWQTWNTALATTILQNNNKGNFSETMKRLRAAFEESQSPEADKLAALAAEARMLLHSSTFAGDARRAVLQSLGEPIESLSWDELCQKLAALIAVERSLRDSGTAVSDATRQRLRQLAEALKFPLPGIEWPAVFEQSATMWVEQVSRELESVRRELLAGGGSR